MKKRLLTVFALVFALLFAFTACAGGGAASSGVTPGGDLAPIKLGNIQDLTGSASEPGTANAWGVEYAVRLINEAGGINGRMIELTTLDCKNDANEALNAYRKLVDEVEIDALIGPPLSNSALTWVEACAEDEIPVVGHFMDESCTTDPETGEVFPYMFLAEPGSRQQAFSIAEYALVDLELTTFATIYNSANAFAISQALPFMAYIEAKGGEVLAEETFTWADTDYSAQCIKVAKANPDAVYLSDYAAQMKLCIEQLREAGYTGIILGANTLGPPFPDLYEGDLDNIYFVQNVDMYDTEADSYPVLQAFMEETGRDYPVVNACFGYDAVMVMADAMRRAEDPTNGQEVRDLLEATKDVATSSGPITIDPATHRPVGMGMYIGHYTADRTIEIVAFVKVDEDAI